MNLTITQTETNKYKINGKGRSLTGRTMWAKVTDIYGTPINATLTKADGEEIEIFFSATGWGRKDGKRI